MWADRQPVVIDPGSGAYHGELRQWSRATSSHSTVEIDGQDQCVFLGDFRAARLPRVSCGPLDRREDSVIVSAEQDGYRRLSDPVAHHRTFCWLPGDGLVVVDTIGARAHHRVRSRLHLPDHIGSERVPLAIRPLWDGRVTERPGRMAPYLGCVAPARILEQEADPGDRVVHGWSLLRSDARVRREGETVTVERPGRAPVAFTLG
jgi:hypothetical protein